VDDPRRERDVKMMRSPIEWPRWPMLPVKRSEKTGPPECGIMWATGEPIVYHCNMWAIPDDLTKAPQTKYDSFDAVVEAGWQVD
jgi:hypothetical protein